MIPQVTTLTPSQCASIADVRGQIDKIDKVIIALLGERFEYVKEVVKYKAKTASGIEANERRTSMMYDRRAWAEESGLSPDVIEQIYAMLVQYFIDEEKKIANID